MRGTKRERAATVNAAFSPFEDPAGGGVYVCQPGLVTVAEVIPCPDRLPYGTD